MVKTIWLHLHLVNIFILWNIPSHVEDHQNLAAPEISGEDQVRGQEVDQGVRQSRSESGVLGRIGQLRVQV